MSEVDQRTLVKASDGVGRKPQLAEEPPHRLDPPRQPGAVLRGAPAPESWAATSGWLLGERLGRGRLTEPPEVDDAVDDLAEGELRLGPAIDLAERVLRVCCVVFPRPLDAPPEGRDLRVAEAASDRRKE